MVTVVWDVDERLPLAELTATLDERCDAVDSGGSAVLVLRLGSAAPAADWPGPAAVHGVSRWERAVRRLERLDAMTVATATHTCGGPALDLLLAVDHRIGTAQVRLQLAAIDGLPWPGMALYRLVNRIGPARARQLLVTSAVVTADRAEALGLVDEITDDVDQAVKRAVGWAAAAHGVELAVRRQLMLEATHTSFEDALGAHLAACDRELRRRAGTGPEWAA
jgi:isomerase DpgB